MEQTKTASYNPPAGFAKYSPIDRAAHLFACFHARRAFQICAEEGITEDQAREGARIAEIAKDVHRGMCAYYGSPEYGAWPVSAVEDRRQRLRERGVAVFTCAQCQTEHYGEAVNELCEPCAATWAAANRAFPGLKRAAKRMGILRLSHRYDVLDVECGAALPWPADVDPLAIIEWCRSHVFTTAFVYRAWDIGFWDYDEGDTILTSLAWAIANNAYLHSLERKLGYSGLVDDHQRVPRLIYKSSDQTTIENAGQ